MLQFADENCMVNGVKTFDKSINIAIGNCFSSRYVGEGGGHSEAWGRVRQTT